MSATQTTDTPNTAAAELSNRREIPVTAFDFLDGAYRKSVRARRLAIGIAGITTLAAVALAALSVPAWNSGTQAQADTELAIERREQLFSSLGTAAGTAVGQEDLILRYKSLTDTYLTLLLRGSSAGEIVTIVSRASGEAVASIRIGYSTELLDLVPSPGEEGARVNDRFARPRLLVTLRGETIGDAVLAAEALRSARLNITREIRGGVSSVTVGAVEDTQVSPSLERLLQDVDVTTARPAAIEAVRDR